MDAIKQQAHDQMQEEMQRYLNTIEAIDALPDGLPVNKIQVYAGGFAINLPHNPEVFKRVRRTMGRDWKFERRWTNTDDGITYCVYRNAKRIEFVIRLKVYLEGATCRKVQVGTATVPVYEIVCG